MAALCLSPCSRASSKAHVINPARTKRQNFNSSGSFFGLPRSLFLVFMASFSNVSLPVRARQSLVRARFPQCRHDRPSFAIRLGHAPAAGWRSESGMRKFPSRFPERRLLDFVTLRGLLFFAQSHNPSLLGFLSSMKMLYVIRSQKCPICGSTNIHRSKRKGLAERIACRVTPIRPFRCNNCDARIYALQADLEKSA